MPHYLEAAFWETRFNISEDHKEFLASRLRRLQQPLTVVQIHELIVSKVIKEEEEREPQIRCYTPQEEFRVGDRLLILHEGSVVLGRVISVNPGGLSSSVGCYSQKINVELYSAPNDVGKIHTYIGGCPSFGYSRHSPTKELLKGKGDWYWSQIYHSGFTSLSQIASRFRSIIEPKIKSALENDGRFLYFDLQYYLYEALKPMDPDRLAAAYSAITTHQGPVKSLALAEMIFGLAVDTPGFHSAHFSMNCSLAKDDRFRNVGRPGNPEWTVSAPFPSVPQQTVSLDETKIPVSIPPTPLPAFTPFEIEIPIPSPPTTRSSVSTHGAKITASSCPVPRPPVPPHEAKITVTQEMLLRGSIPVTLGVRQMIDFYGFTAQVILLAYGGYEIKTKLDPARKKLVGSGIKEWFEENSVQCDNVIFVRSPHSGKKNLRIFTYWESTRSFPHAHPVRSNLYLRHQAYSLLRAVSRFMHYKIIAEEISKKAKRSVSPSSVDTILAQNDHLFKRHARGIWGLQEWSPTRVPLDSQSLIMAIAEDDLVYRELHKCARPMTTREICQAIADYYSISVSQVSEIMPIDPQDPRIEQLGQGYWALRRTITTSFTPGQLQSGLLLKRLLGKRFPRLSTVELDLRDSESIRQSAQHILAALGWPVP